MREILRQMSRLERLRCVAVFAILVLAGACRDPVMVKVHKRQQPTTSPKPEASTPATDEPVPAAVQGSSGTLRVEPLPVGGDVRPPVVVTRPKHARLFRLGQGGRYGMGLCVIKCVVDSQGVVKEIEIVKPERPPADLAKALTDDLAAWKFRPASLHGKPVPVYFVVSVTHCPAHRLSVTSSKASSGDRRKAYR